MNKALHTLFFFAFLASFQANAQVAPLPSGQCYIVPSVVFNYVPAPNMNFDYFTQWAVGNLTLERPYLSGLKKACGQFGDFFASVGPKRMVGQVTTVLIANKTVYFLD